MPDRHISRKHFIISNLGYNREFTRQWNRVTMALFRLLRAQIGHTVRVISSQLGRRLWRRMAVRFRPSSDSFKALEFFLETLKFLVAEVFKVDQTRSSTVEGSEQLVELEMNGFAVAVLGVLNQEDDEEGNDSGARIDHQLPRVRVMKERPSGSPDDNGEAGQHEGPR